MEGQLSWSPVYVCGSRKPTFLPSCGRECGVGVCRPLLQETRSYLCHITKIINGQNIFKKKPSNVVTIYMQCNSNKVYEEHLNEDLENPPAAHT